MLKTTQCIHVDGNELFPICEERCDEEVEGMFNDYYGVNGGSICFGIPEEDEMWIEDDAWKLTMIQVLLENGFHYGDTVYIDCDY